MKSIHGEYNHNGYSIYAGDEQLYGAGNHPHDSQGYVKDGLPLRTIRRYCIKTGKEIAKERNQAWIGAIRIGDEEL